MHELGIVTYVIDQVDAIMKQNDLTELESVTLEFGEVSGVEPEYLVDCWNWARAKSEFMKSAELKVENLEAVTFCEDCQKTYPTLKYKKICPYCGSEHTYLLTGNEYNIKEIEAY